MIPINSPYDWSRANPLMLADRMVPVAVAAIRLGKSRATFNDMIRSGKLRVVRDGGRVYIPVASLYAAYNGNLTVTRAITALEREARAVARASVTERVPKGED